MREDIKKRIEVVCHGEVLDGYRVENGYLIPNDWKTVPLNSRFTRSTRKNKSGCENVLTISAQMGLVNQREFYDKDIASDDKSGYFLMKSGEFAYNKSYSTGYPYGAIKQLIKYDEGIVSPLYICFAPKAGTNTAFYTQYFEGGRYNREIYRIAQEGARNHGLLNVAVEDFFTGTLVEPGADEQQKIAEILATCDRVIELKQQLLEEKRRQKKWLMQKLLDPNSGTRMPGFGQSDWVEVSLRDCCVKKGEYGLNAPACDYSPELPQYVRITDIDDNGKYMKEDPVSVNVSDADEYYLHEGDLLFVRTGGTTGKVYRYENSDGLLVYAGFLIRFSVNLKDYDDCFVYSQFSTMGYANWVKVMSMRSGQPGINAEEYGSFKFWVPRDRAEQSAIATVFKCNDREIELLQNDLQYWQQKKKALMQLLLTGLVRV